MDIVLGLLDIFTFDRGVGWGDVLNFEMVGISLGSTEMILAKLWRAIEVYPFLGWEFDRPKLHLMLYCSA